MKSKKPAVLYVLETDGDDECITWSRDFTDLDLEDGDKVAIYTRTEIKTYKSEPHLE